MGEAYNHNYETESDDQEPAGFDSLTQNSEETWRKMQEARERAEQERLDARNERMGEEAVEVDYHLNPDNKVIGEADWKATPTEDHQKLKERLIGDRRRQELIERAINDSFYSIEEIEGMVEMGAEGASKRTETFEGQEITVYNTGNIPFRYLAHAIQYPGATVQRLVEDPSLWNMSEENAKQTIGESFSNMLSMTYEDSIEARNMSHSLRDSVRYGFLHIAANTLAHAGATNGELLNKSEEEISLPRAGKVSEKEYIDGLTDGFKEVQTFRYDEQGNVIMKPDFIIAPKSGLNKEALRQAAFFGVPVFEIPTRHVETDEERTKKQQEAEAQKREAEAQLEAQKQEIQQKIEKYIQNKLEANASDLDPTELAQYEENMRQLASGTDNPNWTGRAIMRNSTLYKLVQQLESLKQ